jgi:plastin-1
MSGFVGVVVSDPSLQGQFTQVELRSLKAKVTSPNPRPSSLENRCCSRSISSVPLQLVVVFVWLQFVSLKRDSGHVTTKNLPGMMKKLRGLNEVSEEEIGAFLSESYPDTDQEIEFESFLQVHLNASLRSETSI